MTAEITKLLRLILDYPELPIVPMVSGEIAQDDCRYWMGEWGSSVVDKYLISDRSERIYFYSDDDVFDVLEGTLSTEEYNALPWSEEECREIYDKLPWTKAIIVPLEGNKKRRC